MKIIMFGTPTCHSCQSIKPRIQAYCESQQINFEYKNLMEISNDDKKLLRDHRIMRAPAFIIYRSEKEPVVVSGDDVFITLETL